jgi:hypothetical protein
MFPDRVSGMFAASEYPGIMIGDPSFKIGAVTNVPAGVLPAFDHVDEVHSFIICHVSGGVQKKEV